MGDLVADFAIGRVLPIFCTTLLVGRITIISLHSSVPIFSSRRCCDDIGGDSYSAAWTLESPQAADFRRAKIGPENRADVPGLYRSPKRDVHALAAV